MLDSCREERKGVNGGVFPSCVVGDKLRPGLQAANEPQPFLILWLSDGLLCEAYGTVRVD